MSKVEETTTGGPRTVLVSGITGYIGAHLARVCLQAGFRVRGTTRSLKNKERVAALRAMVPGAEERLELIELDLLKGDWNAAVRGCQLVLHCASPFDTTMKEAEIVRVAVDGTRAVLAACAATNGAVQRVVVTSSIAAIAYGHKDKDLATYSFSEKDWTNPDAGGEVTAYVKSKVMAERFAWDYVKKLPEAQRFELATVNPMFVLGPTAIDYKQGGTSINAMKDIMNGKIAMVPDARLGVVDVRDVADAHLRALTAPEAAGQRYLACAVSTGFREIVAVFAKNFPEYKIPTRNAPKFAVWLASFFDNTAAATLPSIGKSKIYDNAKARALGVTFRPMEETLVEMGHSLIARGIVPDPSKDGSVLAKSKAFNDRVLAKPYGALADVREPASA